MSTFNVVMTIVPPGGESRILGCLVEGASIARAFTEGQALLDPADGSRVTGAWCYPS